MKTELHTMQETAIQTLIPRTHFPASPYNRWTNWTGVLGNDDWKYVMTDSVREYIFKAIISKCRTMKFDPGTCEEIAVSVSTETYLAVQNLCQNSDSQKRTIRNSIRALVNTIANQWFLHFISRFYSSKNTESILNFENIAHEEYDVERFVIRTEILAQVFECMKNLSATNKTIINQFFFEDKNLESIASELKLKQHQLRYRKKKAEELIANCLKTKGFN